MTINITSLTDISQDDFNNALATISSLVTADNPDVDIKRGAFYDLVLYISSQLNAVNTTNLNRARKSSSLQELLNDTTLIDDTIVDNLVANYGITRKLADYATGKVVVIFKSQQAITISAGTTFKDSNNNYYTADETYNGKTSSGDVVLSTDRYVSPVGNGKYYYVINVTASATGTAGNLAAYTSLTPQTTISYFDSAYVNSDFTGGTEEETTTQLLARISTSWAGRSLASRAAVEGLIRAQTNYENVLAVSTIGFGDSEQVRNHSIFPIALGGRVDTYVRTQGLWTTFRIDKTAVYQGADGSNSSWQINITRDEAPGFYSIIKIVSLTNASSSSSVSYSITNETRNYDITSGSTDGLKFIPDIQSATEAAYTRYQTCTVTFTDTDTANTGLTVGVSTATYAVFVKYMTGLTDLQDAVCSRTYRSLNGDCLIKAPVPCFVSVTMDIGIHTGATAPTTSLVKQAIADAINNTGFIGTLPITTIIEAANSVFNAGNSVTTATMSGSIRLPSGSSVSLSSTSTALNVGNDTANMRTNRTVCFFCNISDITITTSTITSNEI